MSICPNAPILVTGAAGGKQGSTGRAVTKLLLGAGAKVRAFVRREDSRSEALRSLGAELFVGDLLNPEDVFRSFEGCKRAFFAFPVTSGLLHTTTLFAEAGRRAEAELVVDLCHLNNGFDAPSPRTREHMMSELIFDWADVGAVHLRAAVFMENLRRGALEHVMATGVFALPLGPEEMPIPVIAGVDVAKVAAKLLIDRSLAPARSFPIMTAVATPKTIAASWSAALGREIPYRPMDPEAWKSEALAREGDAFEVEHLSKLWWTLAHPDPDTSLDLRKASSHAVEIIGEEPMTMERVFIGDTTMAF